MSAKVRFLIGTSGYSFTDWIGRFYPPETRKQDMFACYIRHFDTVELNFTFYRIPTPKTLASLADRSPDGFTFWVKGNREITHERTLTSAEQFMENLSPLQDAGKLAGVLLQFPQSFHRSTETRKYLSKTVSMMSKVPLAVEFRHASWDKPETLDGLRQQGVSLVVPDVPYIPSLYRPAPCATTETAYIRLHSRNEAGWYGGMAERYNYSYSDQELRLLLDHWKPILQDVHKVYAFFNNCHYAQAAYNAQRLAEILEEVEDPK